MGVPCIDDSCNVVATTNTLTKHLTLTAKVAPGGGLLPCYADAGLGINLIGTPGQDAAVDQGLVRLGLTPGGELWVAPSRARTENFGGGAGAGNNVAARIKHDGTESLTSNTETNPISDNVLTNPYDTAAVCIVTGTFRLGWTIPEVAVVGGLIGNEAYRANPNAPSAILYTPYHAKIRAQIVAFIGTAGPTDWPAAIAANTAAPQKTAFFDVSGMARNDKAPQHLRDWRDFVFALIVPATKKVFLAGQASHDGDLDIRTFVDTETFPGSAPDFPDRGIRCSGEAIWLPFNGQAV